MKGQNSWFSWQSSQTIPKRQKLRESRQYRCNIFGNERSQKKKNEFFGFFFSVDKKATTKGSRKVKVASRFSKSKHFSRIGGKDFYFSFLF